MAVSRLRHRCVLPQVQLEGPSGSEDVLVQLFEARPGDPAVPQGKAFATISARDAGISIHPPATGAHSLAPMLHLRPASSLPASLADLDLLVLLMGSEGWS